MPGLVHFISLVHTHEEVFTIHSPLLHVRLLPSYLSTQSIEVRFHGSLESVQHMGDIVVVFWFPLIIGGMFLGITWAISSVP